MWEKKKCWLPAFLAPLAVGLWAYVMSHQSAVCPSARPSFCVCVNIFSETSYPILMEFHKNVPAMVLFRIY